MVPPRLERRRTDDGTMFWTARDVFSGQELQTLGARMRRLNGEAQAPARDQRIADTSGVQLSRYHIEDEIGRGGMGVVYRAVDTRLGRSVALKMLPPQATADPERRARFIQEARSASALNHPNIVTIYDVGEADGTTFIAMELVDGTPLDQVLLGGALAVGDAVQYAIQIASALAAAHDNHIVHRRHQAGEHHDRAGWPGQSARFWSRQVDRGGSGERP